jgi:hypothetical protein
VTEIKVEVVSPDTGQAAFFRPKQMPSFQERAGDLGGSLNEIATELSQHLDALDKRKKGWHLDEVTLGFSLDLQAEAGVVVGRVSSKAGLQATMTWKRSSERETQ